MRLFTRSLWPEQVAHPYLRLSLAMLLSPTILVALGTGISFVIAGFSEATRAGTMAVTTDAGVALAALAALLLLVSGLPGVAALWALGARRLVSWGVVGAVFGAFGAIFLGLVQNGRITGLEIGIGAAFSLLMFLLIRMLAGIRTR